MMAQHSNTILDPTGAVMASGPQIVPNMQFLPAGITAEDYANMPPEHKYIVDKQMITAQQAAQAQVYAQGLARDTHSD